MIRTKRRNKLFFREPCACAFMLCELPRPVENIAFYFNVFVPQKMLWQWRFAQTKFMIFVLWPTVQARFRFIRWESSTPAHFLPRVEFEVWFFNFIRWYNFRFPMLLQKIENFLLLYCSYFWREERSNFLSCCLFESTSQQRNEIYQLLL